MDRRETGNIDSRKHALVNRGVHFMTKTRILHITYRMVFSKNLMLAFVTLQQIM